MTLLRSTVSWHVFALTRSEAALGAIGLVQFLPALALTLVGGAVADAYDRRRIMRLAQLPYLASAALLFAATAQRRDLGAAALRGGVRERASRSRSTAPRARRSCRASSRSRTSRARSPLVDGDGARLRDRPRARRHR